MELMKLQEILNVDKGIAIPVTWVNRRYKRFEW